MTFIKYPVSAFFTNLTKADHTIFLHLLHYHFQFCSGKYDRSFYMTDRDLASLTSCSLDTIWKAKKRLVKYKCLTFEIGPKNRTYYTILSPNGKPPK